MPGGLRAPLGRVAFCGYQAGREECWPERYTPCPPPQGKAQLLLVPRGHGDPLPWLHSGREFPDTHGLSLLSLAPRPGWRGRGGEVSCKPGQQGPGAGLEGERLGGLSPTYTFLSVLSALTTAPLSEREQTTGVGMHS